MPEKIIYFTKTELGVYVEENTEWGGKVPISEENALIAYEILREKVFMLEGEMINYRGMIPENIIKIKAGTSIENLDVIWWLKGQKRYISHVDEKKSGIFYYPPILLRVFNGELFPYALQENKKPTGETRLFKLPVPNIYASGNMCFGSVKSNRKVKNINSLIKDMELSLFSSKFSHGLSTAPMKCENPSKIFEQMYSGKLKEFPSELLIDAKVKLKELL